MWHGGNAETRAAEKGSCPKDHALHALLVAGLLQPYVLESC
jgi:hypothetical protein